MGEPDYIPSDWIDPHDMRNYDRHSKSMRLKKTDPSSPIQLASEKDHSICSKFVKRKEKQLKEEIKRYEIFMQRFINHFLQVAKLNDKHTRQNNMLETDVPMKISPQELATLLELGRQFSSKNLNELDEVFVKMFVLERDDHFIIPTDIFFDLLSILMQHKLAVITLLVTAVCSYSLWMVVIGRDVFQIMGFLYIICFLLGLIWNSWHMYEEALIKQRVQMSKYRYVPPECTPSEMGWFQYLIYMFKSSSSDDCLEYYRAHYISPLFTVAPSIVLSETMSAMLLYPVGKLGRSLNEFLLAMSNSFFWPLNHIMYCVILILLGIFVLCVLALYLRQTIKIWTLLGGFSVGKSFIQNKEKEQISSYRENTAANTIKTADEESSAGSKFSGSETSCKRSNLLVRYQYPKYRNKPTKRLIFRNGRVVMNTKSISITV